MNAIGIAQGGIRAAWDRMESGARQVASGAPEAGEDLVDGMLAVRLAAREVQANAKVLERADAALGTLLDVRA